MIREENKMETVTVTFEQNGKKAVGKMIVDGSKVNLNLGFEPALDAKDLDKPLPVYVKLAVGFIEFLKKGR